MTTCELCLRDVSVTTRHHLTPREFEGTITADLCQPCHRHIHAVFTNRTLAESVHTIEALRQTPEIRKWLRFICKQPDKMIKRSVRSKQKR